MKSIGERIKELREQNGLNQMELAKILNVHKGSVSNWENNKRTPDADMLIKIAKYFDCSIDFLLGNTDIKNSLDSFNNAGNLKNILELLSDNTNLTEKDLNNLENFSTIIDHKLKEANLSTDNMTYEEKVALADKILNILKLIENK
ncbi:helix-turn-helix domain-containing protein [Clostridium sporogenes]|uniref:helix-turn-helix domain-containing protein n=1 Tax=Clostridium sporogenes TaxID=1509 RepID=UPI00223757D4|nr:helix-turn-helix domain-containing protein [Clostridium sporogenes]MCW6088871.1 helix-turn-helix domain-containing protein [Clostridium sporogenes]